MKKIILIILLIILIFAISIELPDIDITGLFLKATSTIVDVLKAIAKQVLTFIASKL